MNICIGDMMNQQKSEDVILILNIQESILLGKINLETYTGRIKFLKSNKYSGPLHKVDIFYLANTNLTPPEMQELRDLIGSDGCFQITKSKHLIRDEIFFKLIKRFASKGMIYAMDKDYQKHSVNSFESLNQFYKSADLFADNKKERYALINTSENSILYSRNAIFRFPVMGERLGISAVGRLEIIDDVKDSNEIFNVVPKAVLYIEWESEKLNGNLVFQYDTAEIPSNAKDEFVLGFGVKICRNKRAENEALTELINAGWLKSQNNSFVFDAVHYELAQSVNKLLSAGFILLTEDNKKISYANPINIGISYDMDWFKVSGSAEISGRIYELSDLMANRKKGKHWIELDGHMIVLPNAVTDLYKISNIQSNQLIINKSNVGQLYNLTEALNVGRIKNLEKLVDYSSITLELPDQTRAFLREYQTEGIRWLLYLYLNGFGGCLADDMGLGKTLQAIALLSDSKVLCQKKQSLIIVPKTLMYNWKSEILKFNPSLSVNIYHGSNRYLDLSDLIITTYGTLLNDIEQLEKHDFNLLILDEAQVLKNSSTKSYKATKRISAGSIVALTGTPVENNITELWSLMNLLNPGIFGSKKDFVKKFVGISSSSGLEKELNNLIKPFVLRRLKKDVLSELPDKVEQTILCEATGRQNDLYLATLNYIKEEIKRIPGRYEIKSNEIVLQGLLYLRQICCHPKLLPAYLNVNHCNESGKFEKLKELISNVVSADEKIVVFSQFTGMLRIIENWIIKKQWKYYYLDGKTNNRIDLINQFEKDEGGIFLISLKAGGLGINLTSAHYAVIYDPWWNPAAENQAEDRLYRIGQKHKVTIYKMITAGTIEEMIQSLQEKKSELTKMILKDKDIHTALTKELMDVFFK
jgi:SNF2 family DNA or RNA helicase